MTEKVGIPLTVRQRRDFDEKGFVRIRGSFSRVDAETMENLLWAALREKHRVDRNDPATWTLSQATGLQRLRSHPAFKAIGSPRTLRAIDELLGPGRWKRPRQWGQFLLSFPVDGRQWNVPHKIWHTDFGFLGPADRPAGVLVFSFLSAVPPQSGGTGVVEGSHRLLRRFVETQPREVLEKMKRVRKAFLGSEPWLRALTSNPEDPGRIERFMNTEHVISGIPLRVAELTGEAGDVVVGHPWLLHASTPNCGSRPKIMCVQRVRLAGAGPN